MQKGRKILFMSLVFVPLCSWIDKKGERNLEFLYACLFYLLPFTIGIKIGIKCIFCLLVSRGIFCCIFWLVSRAYLFHWYQISCLCIFMFERSLHIFTVYCYAWVKGEFLWSLTLIYAYITPWVLSSSKRGRLLAQKPFTLVLMMINSCSYSLLIILWYLVSDIWSRY